MSQQGKLSGTSITTINGAGSAATVKLRDLIVERGEGALYRTDKPNMVAKVYHQIDDDKVQKLGVMLRQAPTDPGYPNRSIAWPSAVAQDHSKKVIGFVMPEVINGLDPTFLYVPTRRKKHVPNLDWYHLHHAALNIARSFQAVHDLGYVIGDVKPDNLLVTPNMQVCLVDTDSFQVTDRTSGRVYPCPVTSRGFTPPELVGDKTGAAGKIEHDNFGLATLIYTFLFCRSPYSGGILPAKFEGSEIDERVVAGLWQWNRHTPLKPHEGSIPLEIVHPDLVSLFRKCFDVGHSSPKDRPSAKDWVQGLTSALSSLVWCERKALHVYSRHSGGCPWCQAAKAGGDIFGGGANAKSHSITNLLNEFDRHIVTGDLPSALELIDRYSVLRTHDRTARGREIIGRNANHIKEFRLFCKEIKTQSNEMALLAKLKGSPALLAMAKANRDTEPYVAALQNLEKVLAQLDRAIENAEGGLRSRASIVSEDAILKVVKENASTLTKHKSVFPYYGSRLAKAKSRVDSFQAIIKGLGNSDALAVVSAVGEDWDELKNILELKSYSREVGDLVAAHRIALRFVDACQRHEADEAKAIWDSNPILRSSPLARVPWPELDGQSVANRNDELRSVGSIDLATTLAQAVSHELEKSTADSDLIARSAIER